MFCLESLVGIEPNIYSLKGSRPRPLDDRDMATRKGIEPFWFYWTGRRLTTRLTCHLLGAPPVIRTQTVQGLNLLPLPIGLEGLYSGQHGWIRTNTIQGLSLLRLPIALTC